METPASGSTKMIYFGPLPLSHGVTIATEVGTTVSVSKFFIEYVKKKLKHKNFKLFISNVCF